MLQSADIAAKSLCGNTLTSRKVHLVGAAGHEQHGILWPNPQNSVKQPLNYERMTIYSGHGDGRPSMRRPSPLPQLAWLESTS
jgi:hypothetical protein